MERICNLYIDKTHLSLTIFEYMKREIDKGTKVIIVSQDDIKKNIKNIRERFLQKRMNSSIDYLNSIDEEILKKLDNITIVLQGDEEFIAKMEKDLKEKFNNENININLISCYNVCDNINIDNVINNYDKVLNTEGIIQLKKDDMLDNMEDNEKEKCDV